MRLHLAKFYIFPMALLCGASNIHAVDHKVMVGGTSSDGYYTTANLVFTPSQMTINAGDTVTFTNAGGAAHNVHSTSGPTSFHCSVDCVSNNAPNANAWSDTVTFPTAGTIDYQCDMHGAQGMTGSIIVNAVTPSITLGGYMSGNWFDATDANQSGQGFQIEATSAIDPAKNQPIMVAIWFVFAPAAALGQNQWIFASGDYDKTSNTVTLNAETLTGAAFPPNYSSLNETATPWGTITFTFSDCNNGTASWSPTAAGYASGSMPINRGTQIDGTTCP
jgi:plastocyanin